MNHLICMRSFMKVQSRLSKGESEAAEVLTRSTHIHTHTHTHTHTQRPYPTRCTHTRTVLNKLTSKTFNKHTYTLKRAASEVTPHNRPTTRSQVRCLVHRSGHTLLRCRHCYDFNTSGQLSVFFKSYILREE